jgi:uncharacterized protein (TIGR00661 family)
MLGAMVRIVYGVSGEGGGHASRARAVLDHLEGRGHRVKVVSYDRGCELLRDDFDVFETEGLHLASVENKVSVVRTFTDNLCRLTGGVARLRDLRQACFREFEPECVITDFEPMTAHLANHHHLPLVTIDNQHRMRYMTYPRVPRLAADALVTEAVIRAIVPRPDYSLVTTFYRGDVSNERTMLVPPVLRSEVREARPECGEHVLVYFTHSFDRFHEHLLACGRERFIVYGAGREGEERNLRFKAPSRSGFLEDFATARAVVATAGFSLITEALHLGKPYLALPMRGQFEQELNALMLEAIGCGSNGREARRESLGDFLYRLPDYEQSLAEYPRAAGNRELFGRLDELLADDCREARALHRG